MTELTHDESLQDLDLDLNIIETELERKLERLWVRIDDLAVRAENVAAELVRRTR